MKTPGQKEVSLTKENRKQKPLGGGRTQKQNPEAESPVQREVGEKTGCERSV